MDPESSTEIDSGGGDMGNAMFADMDSLPTDTTVEPASKEVEPEQTQEPGQVDVVEPEGDEPSKVETPVKDTAEKPVVDTPVPSELDKLRAERDMARDELNRLSATYLNKQSAAQQVQQDTTYIANDEDIPELFSTAKGLNDVFNKVERQALLRVPSVVEPIAQEAAKQAVSTSMFWLNNVDLMPHQEYLAGVVDQLQAKNPNATFDQLTGAATDYVRKQLGTQRTSLFDLMKVNQVQPGAPMSQVPQIQTQKRQTMAAAVPPTVGARRTAPVKLEGLDAELAALDLIYNKPMS